MEETINTDSKMWHAMPSKAVLAYLEADPDGLSSEQAVERMEKYGKNKLPEQKQKSALVRFLKQFDNILIYVLMAAAVITALMDHWIDTWVIAAVICINAVIGFIQEGKAEKALEGIKNMLSLKASVRRDGKRDDIKAEDLVPGDIVFLKSGDKVPADLRVLEAKNFKVEESPLTGESSAVTKKVDAVAEKAVLGDRFSMAYSGTVVTYGNATGVVVATGAHTELGKINKMLSEVQELTTPLLRQIDEFGMRLAQIILGVTALFFAFGYFVQDYALEDLFLAVIGLAVAAIPEGLPAIMTITLAIGVQRMARRNAIIRRLPSVETLGSITVICSDKTGTLTRNEMTSKVIVLCDQSYDIEGTGYAPDGHIVSEGTPIEIEEHHILKKLITCIWVCNNSEVRKNKKDQWELRGEPTEGALKTLGLKAGFADFDVHQIDSIPFESEHKYMATLNEVDGDKIIYVKGAPERLLNLCKKELQRDGESNINVEYWKEKMDEVAGKGQRMIGAAFKKPDHDLMKIEQDDLNEGLIFLGLIGIIDPPRQEAITAIRQCKHAGIQVKMITGDHAITAKAIGLEIGVGDGDKAYTGQELEEIDDEKLREVVKQYDVFARTSPEHKLRLVKALQANNHVCAMTGDGVNDAPALKRADVGIAMGIKGTEVTKDSSEMVLADDNFASIANAVEEGRTVYDNLRKAILFILPTNGAESLVIMIAIILGVAMPITPAQILWVNMVTAVTLALSLSFEPMEEGTMKRPPRDSQAPILGGYFLWRVIFVSVIIGGSTYGLYDYLKNIENYDIAIARTIAVNSLVSGQIFYLFNCRKLHEFAIGKGFFDNHAVFIACGVLLVLQAAFTYMPLMNTVFETAPIYGREIAYPLAIGFGVFVLVEIEKQIIKKWFGSAA